MRLAVGFLCALMTLAGACHSAGNDLLWQVGTPDDSYAEFGLAGHYERYKHDFPGGATFEVGKGDPAKNWLYIQPGPEDKEWAGEGEHPFEVIFHVDTVPKGPFILRIDLVDVSPASPPTLRVRVNESMRSFDLKPGASGDSVSDPTNGREQVVLVYVADGFLHTGRNVVNLTITRGGYVLYDSLSMSRCEKAPSLIDRLSLDSTYLFKENNGLKQIVYGSMDLYLDQGSIRTELTSEEGWSAEQVFDNVPNGHRDLEIEIPPVDKAQKAHLRVFAGGEVFETDGTIYPQKRWRIYLAPSSHFDYGYTAVQDKAMRVHRDNVEHAIDWCARYPGFVWDLEGAFIAEDYLRNGSRPAEFIELAQAGRLGVMGFFATEVTGNCSNEGLIHTLDYYNFLRKEHGIESKCVMQNDVPTMSATIPMILSGHGIRYLSHGTNPVRAGNGQKMNRIPYYWESPDGSKVLVWKTLGSYAECLEVAGLKGHDNMPDTLGRINSLVSDFVRRTDYPFDAILLHGAYMDNVLSDDQLVRVPDMWNRRYAYPKVIFCRGSEFFEYIEANFAGSIATVRGDGGVYWEDGAASSARETAMARTAEQRLVTAEKIAALCGPEFAKKVAGALASGWHDAVVWNEHTWGASCSVDAPDSKETLDQWNVKKGFAEGAARSSKTVLDQAMDRLCSGVRMPGDSLVVFNPSSWPRSERVEFRGADGKTRSLRADDVPPMGYRVLPVSSAGLESEKPAAGSILDNAYYTVEFDPATGAVRSIYDKQLERELVDPSRHGLNTYLYVTGGDRKSWNAPEGSELTVRGQTGASLRKLTAPGRQIMRIACKAPYAKSFASDVVLYDDCKRIDFVNTMDKVENLECEACYFAFPFAFRNPSVRVEIPGGVIRPELDQFPGACRNWYAVQQFVTLSDDSAAVAWSPVDTPMIALGDIHRGIWHDSLKLEDATMFAYVMNNYWFTNYKASQGGPLTFRFSMTSARSISDIQARRFGESVQSPMVARFVNGKSGAKTASSRSFVRVHGEGVVVQAMKPARFSDGTVIRLREMSGKSAKVKLAVSGIGFKRAYLCNLAEDKLNALVVKDGAIDVPCRALGLATVLLER